MRGKGPSLLRLALWPRITPACAGKSLIVWSGRIGRRDHPRVCGEKASAVPPVGTEMGSPPRVRGKACHSRRYWQSAGITPACAGKSLAVKLDSVDNGDHPRVCGEKHMTPNRTSGDIGSLPRVRGKVQQRRKLYSNLGITPACAGKSGSAVAVITHHEDHPRVCGEKHSLGRNRDVPGGSPPRVRGKVFFVPQIQVVARITPACAGKRQM